MKLNVSFTVGVWRLVGAPTAHKARQERGEAGVVHPCGITLLTVSPLAPTYDRKFAWTHFYDVSFVNVVEW